MGKSWIVATVVGLLMAGLEGALIASVDPAIDGWHLAQAMLAWFSFGAVVSMARHDLPPLAGTVLLTVVLNSPWLIAEGVRAGKPEHVGPMIVAGVVGGLLIAGATKLVRRLVGEQALETSPGR